MVLTPVLQAPAAALARRDIAATLRHLLENMRVPFLAMGYSSADQLRPTFILIPGL